MARRRVIPIYVITLRDEPWKWRGMLDHFRSFDIEPRVIYGVSGFALGLRPSNNFALDKHGVPEYIHVTQVACALSHITALNCALTQGVAEFIVAEDDAELSPDFNERWPKARSLIPPDIDVVQLEYLCAEDKPTERINEHLAHVYYPFGAAAIWWRRDAADRAINMLRPIDTPYDILLMRRVFPFLKHAVVTPPLVRQRSASGAWPSSVGDVLKVELKGGV